MDWLLGLQREVLNPVWHFIELHPYWGGVVFVFLNAVLVFGVIPGWLLMLAGGYFFGPLWGSLYAFLGLSLGCSLSFFIGRRYLQSWMRRRYGPKILRLDRAVESHGLSIVFVTRLSPIFPFNLLNYGYGLTRVTFLSYIVGGLGMLPSIIIQVYIGSLAKDVYDMESATNLAPDALTYGSQIFAVVASLVALIYIAYLARKVLKDMEC